MERDSGWEGVGGRVWVMEEGREGRVCDGGGGGGGGGVPRYLYIANCRQDYLVYVYIYIYIYLYIYIYIYIYVCVCVCIHIHVSLCLRLRAHTCNGKLNDNSEADYFQHV